MSGVLGEEEVQRVSLRKVLKIRHVAAIALGFTVADGILLVLSQVLPMVGPSVVVLTIIAGIAYALVLFTGAELSGAMPAADFAGEWGKKTIGGFVGFVGTLSYAMVAITAIGLLWFPMGTYLHQFLPFLPVPVIGTICFLIALVLVYQGALASANAEVALNLIFFGIILVMSIVMLTKFNPANFHPFFSSSGGGYASQAVKAFPFIIYILFGQETMFAGSEERIAGRRFWPKAMALSIIIAMLAFIGMEVSLIGLLPANKYTLAEADYATAAKFIIGPVGEGLFNALAFIAVFHAIIASLYVGSRIVYKMAERRFLPPIFMHINKRTHIPDAGLIFAAVMGAVLGSTYYWKPDFYLQAAAILTTAGLFGWFVICVSHISYRARPALRQKYPSDWMVPGRGLAGTWISILGIAVIFLVLFGFIYGQTLPWWTTPLWVAIIVVWYFIARALGGGGRQEVAVAEAVGK